MPFLLDEFCLAKRNRLGNSDFDHLTLNRPSGQLSPRTIPATVSHGDSLTAPFANGRATLRDNPFPASFSNRCDCTSAPRLSVSHANPCPHRVGVANSAVRFAQFWCAHNYL